MCQSWAPCFTLSTGSMVWVLSNPSVSVQFPTVIALRTVTILMNFFTVSSNELWEMKWLRAFLDMILLFILNHLVRSRQQLINWTFVCSFYSYINHLNSCSPVFGRACGERTLPSPNSSLRFQFTIIRTPARVRTRPDEFLHHFAPTNYKG